MAYGVISYMHQIVVLQSLQISIDTLNNYQHSSAMKFYKSRHCAELHWQ